MSLHSLQKSDLELILSWRNAPAVRQAMFTHHEISPEEHRAWFERSEKDPSVRWFLWLDAAGGPRGVVYFTTIDTKQGTAFWGFYASPSAMPGSGMRMALEAINFGFGELALAKLNAEVLVTNTRSMTYHKKIGFIEEGRFREQHFNGEQRIDVIRLGMLASEWPSYRTKLQVRITELNALVGEFPHDHTITNEPK